ncbi:MAG: hypothetical protein PXX73_04700 [Sideroxydans sp.]|nr:hypothetical protein [Sideroxydans sp.]
MHPINEQKKLELATKVLDFLQQEIAKECSSELDALRAQDEVLILAYHASIGTAGLRILLGCA